MLWDNRADINTAFLLRCGKYNETTKRHYTKKEGRQKVLFHRRVLGFKGN